MTVKNFLPSATVSLSDSSPGTNEILTATATGDDFDGDTVSFSYLWKVNGNIVQSTLTADLTDTLDLSNAGNGDNGDTVTVTVIPGDGSNQGDTVTDTANVGNQVPVVDSVTITNTLRTFTVATTNVVAHDDDGDTLTYDYQWLNGVDLTGETGSTLDLGVAGNGDRGDQISVRVTASDGVATSAAVTSPVKFVMDSPGRGVIRLHADRAPVHRRCPEFLGLSRRPRRRPDPDDHVRMACERGGGAVDGLPRQHPRR